MLLTTRSTKPSATKRNGGIEPRDARGKAMRNRCNAVCRKQAKRAVMVSYWHYITYVVGSRISGIAAMLPMIARCTDNLSGWAILWVYVHKSLEIDPLFWGFGLARLGERAIISTQCKDALACLRGRTLRGIRELAACGNACSNSAVDWGQGSTSSRGGVGLCPFSLFWRLV